MTAANKKNSSRDRIAQGNNDLYLIHANRRYLLVWRAARLTGCCAAASRRAAQALPPLLHARQLRLEAGQLRLQGSHLRPSKWSVQVGSSQKEFTPTRECTAGRSQVHQSCGNANSHDKPNSKGADAIKPFASIG